MILIGQYDSPFVRRVAIALRIYAMPFTHWPLSVFADATAVRALNPLMRVPVLVLEDGLALADSHMMLDHLDGRTDRPLFPRAGLARTHALRRAALACGAAEKAVALFYETRLHDVASDVWESRCRLQVTSVLAALEAEADETLPDLNRPGHDAIALACALRFIHEAHPGLIDLAALPRLTAQARALEETPVFREISQPFAAPA